MGKESKLAQIVETSRLINEVIKPHRPVPRIMIGLYGYLLFEVVMWGIGLPVLTAAQSGLVAAVLGAGTGFFGFYVNSSGKDK